MDVRDKIQYKLICNYPVAIQQKNSNCKIPTYIGFQSDGSSYLINRRGNLQGIWEDGTCMAFAVDLLNDNISWDSSSYVHQNFATKKKFFYPQKNCCMNAILPSMDFFVTKNTYFSRFQQ